MPNQLTSILPGGPTGLGSLSPLGQSGQARQGQDNDNHNLSQAAVEVESLFLGQLLEQMRRAMVHTLNPSSQEVRNYQNIVDQHLARTLAAGGGLGLARRLMEDLAPREPHPQQEDQYEPDSPHPGSTDPPAGDLPVPATA